MNSLKQTQIQLTFQKDFQPSSVNKVLKPAVNFKEQYRNILYDGAVNKNVIDGTIFKKQTQFNNDYLNIVKHNCQVHRKICKNEKAQNQDDKQEINQKPVVKIFFQNQLQEVQDGSSADRVDLKIFGNQPPESSLYEFRNAVSANLFSQSILNTESIQDIRQSLENRVLKATFSDRLTDPKSQDASSGVNARIIYNGRQVQSNCEKIQDQLQNQQFSEIIRPLDEIIQQNINQNPDMQSTQYRIKKEDSEIFKDNLLQQQFQLNNDLEQVNQNQVKEGINYLKNQQNFSLIPQIIHSNKDEALKNSFENNLDSRNQQTNVIIITPSRGSYKGKSKIKQRDIRDKNNSQSSSKNSKQMNQFLKQEQNYDYLLKDFDKQTKISDKQDKDEYLDIQCAKYTQSSLMDGSLQNPEQTSVSPNQLQRKDLSTNNIQKMISKFEEYGRAIEQEVPLINYTMQNFNLDGDATRNIDGLQTDLIISQKLTKEEIDLKSETESPIRQTRLSQEDTQYLQNIYNDKKQKSPQSPSHIKCTCHEWLFLNYEQLVKEETSIISKKYYYEIQ